VTGDPGLETMLHVSEPDELAGERLRMFVTGLFVGTLLHMGTLEVEPHYDGEQLLPSFAIRNPRTGTNLIVNVDRFEV
jgi:hypothetical protein